MADYRKFAEMDIQVDVKDKIATVTLNRPDRLNALLPGMADGWREILRTANEDPDVGAVIITGAGRGFCAGADLGGMSRRSESQGDGAPPPRNFGGLQYEAKYLIQDYLNFQKPLIAAVNGPAAGLGATLALMCDVVFMSDVARIGDTHVRAGLVAGDGGALIWPHLVGVNKAKELLMTGRMIDAQEADKIGLANRVVSLDRLMTEATEFAAELVNGPPLAIKWTKLTINRILWQTYHSVMEFGLALEDMTMGSEDNKEAAKAFVEQRKPNFVGR
ncbi:MAG: enoyl-CoA hydratase/isomerase family protein [SAR202 cluster bacterium]|jgi:enoyl-CoA hydratase|nr:enoyl-CoA hydratase/isomerase family protein [SAR202 cluster bacterium]MDP6301503.1 enoyl-CoA hydratase/isomerase family protein [SAR202 cluster bacterium]MDP7104966.1 enoyl-CoA hydratase/isomerase family protein [SAR202 cluster bacterium]MDP7226554.1 enoyl-CoA hydratase/isomerase family protein [SAR202 cluster bacterium]MDP7414903.1 enoyl-CoA hydratase/isomerase family protein [SAR202 cluster bacterium]|tara:strand:- start:3184 stop:4008 length:825 start_codon:yes stop_codon:yes gene_type:complete